VAEGRGCGEAAGRWRATLRLVVTGFRFRVESQQNDVPGRSILAAVSVKRLSAPQEGWLNLDPTAKDVAISLQSAASEGAQGQLAATLTSFDGRAEPMTISGTFQCSRNE
jgi:hypothetical protein